MKHLRCRCLGGMTLYPQTQLSTIPQTQQLQMHVYRISVYTNTFDWSVLVKLSHIGDEVGTMTTAFGRIKEFNPLITKLSCWNFNLVNADHFSREYLVCLLCYWSQICVLLRQWVAAIAHTQFSRYAPPTSKVKPIKCNGLVKFCSKLVLWGWILKSTHKLCHAVAVAYLGLSEKQDGGYTKAKRNNSRIFWLLTTSGVF